MRLLHIAPSYYPAVSFGGPIWTTYALCNALSARPDVEVRVLTTDTAGEKRSERLPDSDFPTVVPAGYEVYYTHCIAGRDVAPGLLARLPRMLGWADVVLLTGTYSFPTVPTLLACRILDKPVVWSPHGALQATHEWSEARRPVLKRAFETICRLAKPRRCTLHVTAEVERVASCARLPEFDAAIISNAVDFPDQLHNRSWLPDGTLRLMFISRLDPKKGLETLLRALPSLNLKTTLDIYGTGQAAYVRELHALSTSLNISNRVHFHGHVEGDAKRDAFLNADLFVLPTHSENFGMVVAEALAHGVPAVVTHGAPWEELDERGCGRWVENSIGALAAAIEELRLADLADMGAKGRRWMEANFSWEARAADMEALFSRLIADQPSSLTPPAATP
jgi:glycosyltransferase involved in cell wall biosynthesis